MRAPQYAAVEKEFARGGSLKAALAKNMPPPPAAAAAAAVGGTGAQGDGAKVQKGGGLLKRLMGGGGSQGTDISQGREERAKTRVREKHVAATNAQRAENAAVVQHGERWPGLARSRSRGHPPLPRPPTAPESRPLAQRSPLGPRGEPAAAWRPKRGGGGALAPAPGRRSRGLWLSRWCSRS